MIYCGAREGSKFQEYSSMLPNHLQISQVFLALKSMNHNSLGDPPQLKIGTSESLFNSLIDTKFRG
jgi:hypothetical protein